MIIVTTNPFYMAFIIKYDFIIIKYINFARQCETRIFESNHKNIHLELTKIVNIKLINLRIIFLMNSRLIEMEFGIKSYHIL